MRFRITRRWPFITLSRFKLPPPRVHAVRYGADSCLDLALFEVTEGLGVTDSQRFDAALVAWKMLENSSEPYVGPAAPRMGMRSNPFAASRLFVRMLKRAGLEAEIRKTPERDAVPCVVMVRVDGALREVSADMLMPHGARVCRRMRRAG